MGEYQSERFYCSKNITNSYSLLLKYEDYYPLSLIVVRQEDVATISISYKDKLSLDKEKKVVY
jgi:hypothetical protein